MYGLTKFLPGLAYFLSKMGNRSVSWNCSTKYFDYLQMLLFFNVTTSHSRGHLTDFSNFPHSFEGVSVHISSIHLQGCGLGGLCSTNQSIDQLTETQLFVSLHPDLKKAQLNCFGRQTTQALLISNFFSFSSSPETQWALAKSIQLSATTALLHNEYSRLSAPLSMPHDVQWCSFFHQFLNILPKESADHY